MMGKAQATIFFILGITLVIVFGFLFAMDARIDRLAASLASEGTERADLEYFVVKCLEATSEEAAEYLADHAGQYELDGWELLVFLSKSVPVFVHDGTGRAFTPVLVEEQYARYVEDYLPFCFRDFKDFADQGVEVRMGTYDVDVILGLETATVTLHAPTTVVAGAAEKTYDTFTVTTPEVYLLPQLETSNDILENVREDLESDMEGLQDDFEDEFDGPRLCLSCINDIAAEHGVRVEIMDADDSWLVTIIDEESGERFVFAMKKTGENDA